MNAIEFLTYWNQTILNTWDTKKAYRLDTGKKWTDYITGCLHDVANKASLWCACRNGQHRVARNQYNGENNEYLFDFTWYQGCDGYGWPLPKVIIEHENQKSLDAFFIDFWKTLLSYAPLRVAIGYCAKDADRAKWIEEVNARSRNFGWKFPVDSEDLIILGHGTMGPDDFHYYLRMQYERRWERYMLPAQSLHS